jgi:uncharacterized protein YlaI
MLTCECGKGFSHHITLIRHKKLVHQEKMHMYMCEECHASCETFQEYYEHGKTAHGFVDGTFLCGYCPRRFYSKKKRTVHESIKHYNECCSYRCTLCMPHTIIYDMEKYREHVLKSHNLII